MENDPKFTRSWRAAIVIALLLSVATAGFKISVGSTKLSLGPISDEMADQRSKERADEMEERINKIEAYLYKKVAPIVEAEKDLKTKQSDSN